MTSGIELAALKSVCNRTFTLDKKISLFLDSLLMLYKVSEDERKKVIEKVLALDFAITGQDLFEKFIRRLDGNEKLNE